MTIVAPKLSLREVDQQIAWVRRELARKRLIEFACWVDPEAEASTYQAKHGHNPYRAGHLREIADVLERVERGEIKRLYVAAPPRHWKSSLVSEKFSLWFLARNPLQAIISVSHSANVALGFSRNVRDNVGLNPRFAGLFPSVRLAGDATSVHDWSLRGAYRSSFRAVGVGGTLTGTGGNLILDDPVQDHVAAYSKTQRDAMWDWYRETLRDRLEVNGFIICVMSRWHSDDLMGRLLRASKDESGEPWTELRLPAIAADGQALWPQRWPVEELAKIKQAQGTRAFAARYMGDPKPEEGRLLDSTKLVMVDADEVPPLVAKVRRWDLAFSEREGADYLAGAKLGRDRFGNTFILHVKRVHGRWTQGKPIIVETALSDGPEVTCAIEANGTQLGYYQDMQADQRMQRIRVVADKPEGSKEMRASVWGSRLVDGVIKCVRGEWNGQLFDELDSFPNGEHDDCTDAVSGAFGLLGDGGGESQAVPVEREIGVRSARERFAI